jgi:hypothetical protein
MITDIVVGVLIVCLSGMLIAFGYFIGKTENSGDDEDPYC